MSDEVQHFRGRGFQDTLAGATSDGGTTPPVVDFGWAQR